MLNNFYFRHGIQSTNAAVDAEKVKHFEDAKSVW